MSEFAGLPPPLEPPPVVPSSPPIGMQVEIPARPIDPWVSIWTRPRATLRHVLTTDAHRGVFRLAALGGIALALHVCTAPGVGDVYPVTRLLAGALAGGGLGGVLILFVASALLQLTGRWLGGLGGWTDVVAAVAWRNVPAIWGMLLWLPRWALLGGSVLQGMPPGIEDNPPMALFLALLNLAQAVIALWGIVVTLKCLAEAHRFSAWRALGAMLLAGLLVAAPAAALAVMAQAITGS